MATWDELKDIVRGAREIHEMLLRASEINGTAGTCLYASYVLSMSLERFGDCVAVVRGGDGRGDGGVKGPGGQWHGHYWVEGVSSDGIAFTADVTADQFGFDPVYFDRADDSRHRYQPGDDAQVHEAVLDLAKAIAAEFHTS